MKKSMFLISVFYVFNTLVAQDLMTTMEQRALEMHRVIRLSDKEQWKKFMSENYSKALIERPFTSKVETSGAENEKSAGNMGSAKGIEEKLKMFQQLHEDFGNSKLVSVKRNGQNLEMTLEDKSGLKGIFQLRFENKSPYLIDGIGIEAN